jgi:hypothetical protein
VLKGKDQPVNAFVLLWPADPSELERLAPTESAARRWWGGQMSYADSKDA